MKSFKKLLAVVLSLAMVLGSLTVTAVAETTEVSTLAQLNSALANGGDVKLTADISLGKAAATTIEEETEVVIDLNGHNITRSSGGAILTNNGTLTIKDTSKNADGWIGFSSTSNSTTSTIITNNGTIDLLSGGFKQMKNTATSAGQVIKNAGTFNMSGGFISDIVLINSKNYVLSNTGELNISGGVIKNCNTANRPVVQNNGDDAVINFTGGEIKDNTIGTSGTFSADIRNYKGTLNISDDAMLNGKLLVADTATDTSITGGWFSIQPTTSWIADGYRWNADTKTKPGYAGQVIEGTTPKVAAVTIDGETTQYTSFDEAVAAANVADTTSIIKLLDDCVKTTTCTTVAAGTDITLDLNGKTLTNTATYSDASNYRLRYFTVAGTFTIEDTSAEKTGTVYANNTYTGKAGAITYANPGTVYIIGGNYYEGTAQGSSTNNCFANTNGGTHAISDGWFAEDAKPTNNDSYCADGYKVIQVDDESKAATPYTVSNTTKTISYDANGGKFSSTIADTVYSYKEGYTVYLNAKESSVAIKDGFTCAGWSANKNADPDGKEIIGSGEKVNFATFEGDTVILYAIYKEVDTSMWVCVDTNDHAKGYADLASAFVNSTDITLIKNIDARATIASTSDVRLNLNGYNITGSTAEEALGSALVVKATLSIYNEDAGTITVAGTDYKFGGQGVVEGYAQGTGGAVDVIGDSNGVLKIYGGTFKGDAPKHGTVITNSKAGKVYIYKGEFIETNPETTSDSSLYAASGFMFVLPENQSDVKIQGIMAGDTTARLGITGGYFAEIQPAAVKIGTFDNDRITEDKEKALIANTGDQTYPYSVAAKPWYITYNLAGGSDPVVANPTEVAKDDETVYTLNDPTPKTGYEFVGWYDADENKVTQVVGAELEGDLALTAKYNIIEYSITYDNMYDAEAPELTSYTVEDDVTLPTPEREKYAFAGWKAETAEGEAVTDWKAGEKIGDIKLWATWTAKEAFVTIDEETTYYVTFEDAVVAVKDSESAATITLNKNVEIEARQTLSSKGTAIDITLNLNGKTLTDNATATSSGLFLYDGSLTITGEGKIINNCSAMTNVSIVSQRENATLTIDSTGTFTGFKSAASSASSTTPGAGATITAGTYSFDPKDNLDEYHYAAKKTVEEVSTWTVNTYAATVDTDGTVKQYKYMTGTSETKTNYAFDNLVEGDVLTLCKDAAASFQFASEITFTFDLNGYSYDLAKLTAGEGLKISYTLVEEETDVYTVTVESAAKYEVYVEGQETQGFETLDQAVAAVLAAGETPVTLKFTEDVTFASRIELRESKEDTTARNITLDLAGRTLTKGADATFFLINNGTTLNISNGTFDAATFGGKYFSANNGAKYIITGGTFKNGDGIVASKSTAVVSGGKFNVDPAESATLAKGLISTGTTTFTLVAAAAAITKEDGSYVNYAYMNSSQAVAKSALPNIANGDTVTLYKDAAASYTFDKAISFVLDKNGFTYDESKLTVADSELFTITCTLQEGKDDVYDVVVTCNDTDYFEVTSVGGTISDSLGMTIYVTTTKDVVPTLTFQQPDAEEAVTVNAKKMSGSNIKYYYRINDIQVANIAADLGIVFDGEEVEMEIKSILDYYEVLAANEILKGAEANEKLLNLIADTEKYGYEVILCGEGEAFVLPAWTDSYLGTGTPDAELNVKKTTASATDKDNYKITNASVIIDDKAAILFYVRVADASKAKIVINGDEISFVPEIATDLEWTVTVGDNSYKITNRGTEGYRIRLDKIAPSEYNDVITAKLVIDNVDDHAVQYSMNSYCYVMSERTDIEAGLTTASAVSLALYRFGQSFIAYKA